MIILDTDHLSALEYRATPSAFALQARLEGENYDRLSLPTLKKVARALGAEIEIKLSA
ncbi:MAG: hypothetical protein Q8S00_32730 [Deltaproteobacteria bacterium]|nr:hypothetical protein [Deltaproteobacteria bacterium]MDZ4342325.1 hypothetical protein [Candidatus Binatia bacterium]